MQTEIVYLPPVRTATILAALQGFLALCLWAPFGAFVWMMRVPPDFARIPRIALLGLTGFYPVAVVIVGWLASFSMVVCYNFIARYVGGIRVNLRTIQGSIGHPWEF